MKTNLTRWTSTVTTIVGLSLAVTFGQSTWAASDKQYTFEEIVVVAEKRSESVQDISQAVTALSADDLESFSFF